MALEPIDAVHALQIQAGILGRNAGHTFEDAIVERINGARYPVEMPILAGDHVFTGDPALLLLHYIGISMHFREISSATALSTGSLATSEAGKQWLSINGADVNRCKSDLVISLASGNDPAITVGVSTKQCNALRPTNAQLYFTTARGFSTLLSNNGIDVSDEAVFALRQFCGDQGFRPLDADPPLLAREVDPRRYFWEEILGSGRAEWEQTFSAHQDEITRLLLQKAYVEDRFVPDYLLHKTRRSEPWARTEVALYGIEELILLSRRYCGFHTRPYVVRKGSFKDPNGVSHLAPRFGVVQMQRGGQAQHPEQLQFNLGAGYFYKI